MEIPLKINLYGMVSRGIKAAEINDEGHLIFTLTDGAKLDVGVIGGTIITGSNGGYYTLSVSQPDTNTMRVEFVPSKKDMPAIPPVDIVLPKGPKGDTPQKGIDYFTDADKLGMVNAVLSKFTDVSEVGR